MAVGKYPAVDSQARPWLGFAVDWVLLDLTHRAGELLWPQRGSTVWRRGGVTRRAEP
jgi:hypothetical protein